LEDLSDYRDSLRGAEGPRRCQGCDCCSELSDENSKEHQNNHSLPSEAGARETSTPETLRRRKICSCRDWLPARRNKPPSSPRSRYCAACVSFLGETEPCSP